MASRLLPLDPLRAFDATVRRGSVSAAALLPRLPSFTEYYPGARLKQVAANDSEHLRSLDTAVCVRYGDNGREWNTWGTPGWPKRTLSTCRAPDAHHPLSAPAPRRPASNQPRKTCA